MYGKSVSINLNSKCNAMCDHCCFSCSPKSTIKMKDSYIKDTVLEFSKNPNIEKTKPFNAYPRMFQV